MNEGLSPLERFQKPSIERVLSHAQQFSEPVKFYKSENPSPEEETINDIYDGMMYRVKDMVDAFSDDLTAPYNEDLVRSYVALLDLGKKFSDSQLILQPNTRYMSRRQEVGDEIYAYVAVNFTSVGVPYKGEIMIRPKLHMKSGLSESEVDHDADQRMMMEVTPLTPDVSAKVQVRIDFTGVLEYDFDARKPGVEGNIIDGKETYLKDKGIEVNGGHHFKGPTLKGYRSEYRSILERIHHHAEANLAKAA